MKRPAKTVKKAAKKTTKALTKTPAKKATKATTKAKTTTKTTTKTKTTTTTKAAPARTATKAGATATKAAEKAQPVKKGAKKTVICELSGFEVTPGTPNLSPKTLDRLKSRLLEERDRRRAQADDFAAEAEQLAREREGGDTQFDEESGEGDTVNVERERDLLLSASARQEVEDIELALNRMKRGTYGVCRYAGRRLPLERLEVRPWADVCVDCKARADRRR
jgi:RNA polymerase-binding transcription factor DksA